MLQGTQLFLIIVIGWICTTAFFVLLETLFSSIVTKGKEIAEDSPGRAFWLGLINGLFFLALAVLFIFLGENFGTPLIALPGLFFGGVFIIGGLVGLASMIQLIGDRLFPEHSTFKRRSFAAGVTILACLTPYVGWFGLFPYLLLVGFGYYVIRAYNQYRESRVKTDKYFIHTDPILTST